MSTARTSSGRPLPPLQRRVDAAAARAQLPGVRRAGGHTVSRQSSGVPSLGKRASTASTMQRGGTGRRVSILGVGEAPPSKEETDERTKERIANALATPDTRAEAEREESSTPWADKQKVDGTVRHVTRTER